MIRSRPRLAILLLLALLVACAEPPPSAALVHTGPLPVASVSRPLPEGDDAEAHFVRGLAAYGEGRWTVTVQELEAARLLLSGYKDVMAQLFLGSALRLSGRYARALVPLRLVVDEARRVQSSELLDMAGFELAQTLLALGEVIEARRVLREVAGLDDVHASQAAEQLEGLAALSRPA